MTGTSQLHMQHLYCDTCGCWRRHGLGPRHQLKCLCLCSSTHVGASKMAATCCVYHYPCHITSCSMPLAHSHHRHVLYAGLYVGAIPSGVPRLSSSLLHLCSSLRCWLPRCLCCRPPAQILVDLPLANNAAGKHWVLTVAACSSCTTRCLCVMYTTC